MPFRIKRVESSNKTIRMPNDLIDEMEIIAARNGISFNKLVVQCCIYSLAHLEEGDPESKDERCDQESAGQILFKENMFTGKD